MSQVTLIWFTIDPDQQAAHIRTSTCDTVQVTFAFPQICTTLACIHVFIRVLLMHRCPGQNWLGGKNMSRLSFLILQPSRPRSKSTTMHLYGDARPLALVLATSPLTQRHLRDRQASIQTPLLVKHTMPNCESTCDPSATLCKPCSALWLLRHPSAGLCGRRCSSHRDSGRC